MAHRPYRIVVHAKPRSNPDSALLAQVVILLGRHLHQQQQLWATRHAKADESRSSSGCHEKPSALPPQGLTDGDEGQPGEGGRW